MFLRSSSTDSNHLRCFHPTSNFKSFSTEHILYRLGVQAPRPTPILEDQVILFVSVVTFDWSGLVTLTVGTLQVAQLSRSFYRARPTNASLSVCHQGEHLFILLLIPLFRTIVIRLLKYLLPADSDSQN